ncbi:MAG: M23 family metallopeptidase [Dehalococcoidia bacterium]
MPVRTLLVLVCLFPLAAACLGGEGSAPTPGVVIRTLAPTPVPTPTPSPTPTPTPTPVPTPTPSPTPSPSPTPAPVLDLAESFPRQGGFLLVRLVNPPPDLSEVAVHFAEGSYQMLPEGGRWFAVIGLSTSLIPGDSSLEVTAGGATLATAAVSVDAGGFAQEYIELPPESVGLLEDGEAIAQERITLAQVYAGLTLERPWSGAWIMPAAGPITNPFGLQRSINGGPFSPHTGTDIAADSGTPVAAAAGGQVAFAGLLYLRGNSVVIDHGAGVFSGYHHLESIAVAEGQAVAAGDLVGYIGETGLVSGPHLHWEAIIGSVRVDPTLWTFRSLQP